MNVQSKEKLDLWTTRGTTLWRTLKSGLRLCPIYHFAPHRIHAHVAESITKSGV